MSRCSNGADHGAGISSPGLALAARRVGIPDRTPVTDEDRAKQVVCMSGNIREIRGVAFRLDYGWYAVDIMRVREVIRPKEMGHLVSMPPFVSGVLTLRGTVIPVIDLRERFGLPRHLPGRQARVLIVLLPAQPVGLAVDEVSGVVGLPLDALAPPPSCMDPSVAPCFIGVADVRGHLISLVNIDRLLSGAEHRLLGSVTGSADQVHVKGEAC